MIKIRSLLEALNLEGTFVEAQLSQLKKGAAGSEPFLEDCERIKIRAIWLKDDIKIQLEYFKGPKAFHENYELTEGLEKLTKLAEVHYKQMHLITTAYDYDLKINRMGEASVKRTHSPKERNLSQHDRKKQYLLTDGEALDFLIHLGVMDNGGKVFKKKYDKFKQLNRFLEFVEDCMPALLSRYEASGKRAIHIIDFGCGKAYLTFALYHYLVEVKKLPVRIIGLDLKTDVIAYCDGVAKALSYEGLKFLEGDIKDYVSEDEVDMVVTLHACNNATDEALAKAVDWNAKVILSVPCCQHEFFDQLSAPAQEPMLKHGILRDKLNALVTDSLRGLVLEALGYDVQMLEFIDMTHTPKNVLIRAFRQDQEVAQKNWSAVSAFKESWGLQETYLEKSLAEKSLK